jgi:hypothetical protein
MKTKILDLVFMSLAWKRRNCVVAYFFKNNYYCTLEVAINTPLLGKYKVATADVPIGIAVLAAVGIGSITAAIITFYGNKWLMINYNIVKDHSDRISKHCNL